jgi:sulfoxide reductase heme-binding subunit YedZ
MTAGIVGTTHVIRPWTVPRRPVAVWCVRALLAVPFVLMTPEIVSGVRGRPGSVANLSASTAGVLGTSSFLVFALMLAVTPVRTMTGWRWHLVLRRDLGIGMFVVSALDLVQAALTTGDTGEGGLLTRVAGRSALLAGTFATILLVPLVVTANRRAQRRLGPYWRWLHRSTYVVWAAIVLHLFLLFGSGGPFVDAVIVSAPLVVLRIPAVRRWWTSARRSGRHRVARIAAATLLVMVFVRGVAPFVIDLAADGAAAFHQMPSSDD